MYKGPFPAEASPLSASSTQQIGDAGWEPHGSSPTTCEGKADHGFGVCVYERLNTVMAPTCNWRIKIVSN